jgi:tetratricopeptide (TPR) repeat protein
VTRRCAIVLAAVLGGCGPTGYAGPPEEAFAVAVEAHLSGDGTRGGEAAQVFLEATTEDDGRYDRAQLILAESLEDLGFHQAAAMVYLDVASSRRNPELIDRAVGGIERIVRSGRYDGELLVEGFLASAEITGLTPERAAFVAYLQGRDSARRERPDWMEDAFAIIPADSPYAARAELVRAVRHLVREEYDEARERLEALVDPEAAVVPPADVLEEAHLALARLSLEEGRYADAVAAYERVRDAAPRRPTLLLEMAWAHYYGGRPRRALGLLVALDAPMYADLIAPERFLLEALSLRLLCQFEPATSAVVRLQARYREALEDLHGGVTPGDSEALVDAARIRVTDPGAVIPYRLRLREEAAEVPRRLPEGALREALSAFYERTLRQVERREAAELEEETARIAAELIEAEDGVRLVVHELSVALLRGRRRPEGERLLGAADPTAASGGAATAIAYAFDGEFWTDELDDLVVTIPDRCLE